MTFDCLYINGGDLRARSLHERRDALEKVVDDAGLIFPVRRLADDGLKAWDTVVGRGLEGLVAKDRKAAYDARARWLKVKVRHEGQYVIGGVTFHDERGAAIVVGERAGRQLRYRGYVEFGVRLRRLEPLITAMPKIQRARSPFADFDARGFAWVAPRYTAELTYSEVM